MESACQRGRVESNGSVVKKGDGTYDAMLANGFGGSRRVPVGVFFQRRNPKAKARKNRRGCRRQDVEKNGFWGAGGVVWQVSSVAVFDGVLLLVRDLVRHAYFDEKQ